MTAGESVPCRIEFDDGARTARKQWRVWGRTNGALDYREWNFQDGLLQVPSDIAGLHWLKVSLEVEPWQKGELSDLFVSLPVEVRQPNCRGTVSVYTRPHRFTYAAGEEIRYGLLVRGEHKGPVPVRVELRHGEHVLANACVEAQAGQEMSLALPGALTEKLGAGEYRLQPVAEGLTGVGQPLTLGLGDTIPAMRIMQYGDYKQTFPTLERPENGAAEDVTLAHTAMLRKMNINISVDRLGWGGNKHLPSKTVLTTPPLAALKKKLEADPLAAAPAVAEQLPPMLQTQSAYSAYGIQQWSILMGMDAQVPLDGRGWDSRSPEQLKEDLLTLTRQLMPFPSFRGWAWASQWWTGTAVDPAFGVKEPAERRAILAARKQAEATGAWDPILDRAAARRRGLFNEAATMLTQTLRTAAPKDRLRTANSCFFRNAEQHPPSNLIEDEVDLQSQWEQISVPYHVLLNADYYARPGKHAWGHPEIWNDAGTGDQIIPSLFGLAMRGADVLGHSAPFNHWPFVRDDPRIAYFGIDSIFRATHELLHEYGPWINTLENDDEVAIPISSRMVNAETWPKTMPLHFGRVYEAYMACMFLHRPAKIVFSEDMHPDSLVKYKAVVLVDQRYEPEPALATALKNARAAGVPVFYDGLCRLELVSEYTPLGVSFNQVETDYHQASDDNAYWRFPSYIRKHLPAMEKTLGAAVAPVASLPYPEIFLTRRKSGAGRYVFAVNETSLPIQPGVLSRVSLHCASRMPVKAEMGMSLHGTVYDVFALREATRKKTAMDADFRNLPVKLYAVLPSAIGKVELGGPSQASAGQTIRWRASAADSGGQPIRASIPLRLRLLTEKGGILLEQFTADTGTGCTGTFPLALTLPAGALELEAVELLSGRTARLRFPVAAAASVLPLHDAPAKEPPLPIAQTRDGQERCLDLVPAEARFGPHVRDLILVKNGKVAVMNTMNWDHNLYAVDTANGKTLWRQRAGHYFTFAPQALKSGFAVQGYDLLSAEGYHLYLGDTKGRLQRRFATYGLPSRMCHRFVPGLLVENDNYFAAAPDGSWIAAAGNLGLVVWSQNGKERWRQDWSKSSRGAAYIAAIGPSSLAVCNGATLVAHAAADGKELWRLPLSSSGQIERIRVCRDGKTAVIVASSDGGRVFVVRDGKCLTAFPSTCTDFDASADGSTVVLVTENLLKLFTITDGLRWTFSGDSNLRCPRLSPSETAVACASDLGAFYLLGCDGRKRVERDMRVRATLAWLPEGDLLAATWLGDVIRFTGDGQELWRSKLRPSDDIAPDRLLAADGTPTARVASTVWGNAEPQPLPLTENVLTAVKPYVQIDANKRVQYLYAIQNPAEILYDGKIEPPPNPWLRWDAVNFAAEISPQNSLLVDCFWHKARVDAVTLIEDPDHPESWLRDARLEYWDAAEESWKMAQPLLSDASIHSHRLVQPVEAARFRLTFPHMVPGNVRLAELALHGKLIGSSHPDVFAKKPTAVLFDENQDPIDAYYATAGKLELKAGDTPSGGHYLELAPNTSTEIRTFPPLGNVVPNWNFEIVENPEPGQYRWLQFAWKATSPGTSALLSFSGADSPIGVRGGSFPVPPAWHFKETIDVPAPTADWKAVRIDLGSIIHKGGHSSMRLNWLKFYCRGEGGVMIDQIVLGRSEDDLPRLPSKP